ncbi:MAG: NblA/ycf18 family protein [Prochloraceae cyanobacterium]
MANSCQLTLEQQFKLQIFQEEIKNLTKEQAQEYLLELFRQIMIKDNLNKSLLKERLFGIDDPKF